jgi:hydrogenase maturation protease
MPKPRILIAGIGNIFLGDDAFGVEVAQQLLRRPLPDGVRVIDFGIRGLDLTYALLEGCDIAILVDACPRGHAPGTVFVIEPDASLPPPAPGDSAGRELTTDDLLIETHGMHPAKVLRLVLAMGGLVKRILLVGCEPTPFDPEQDMDMSLSEPVRAAIPEAIRLIESLVEQLLNNETPAAGIVLVPGPAADSQSKGMTDHEFISSIA